MEAEGDHFVEHEQGACSVGGCRDPKHEVLSRGNDARRAHNWLDEYCGNLIAVLSEDLLPLRGVVVRGDVGDVRRRHVEQPIECPHLEGFVGAVVPEPCHEDLASARDDSRSVEGEECGLGAGVGEPHRLHRLNSLNELLSQRHLTDVAGWPRRAGSDRTRCCLHDRREGVAVNEAGVVAGQIPVDVSVGVRHLRPTARDDQQRVWPVKAGGPSLTCRHHLFRPQMVRPRRRCSFDVPSLDCVHGAGTSCSRGDVQRRLYYSRWRPALTAMGGRHRPPTTA